MTVVKYPAESQLQRFPGGIEPPERKALANQTPIRQLPLPERLYLPLQQHIGQAGRLLVADGDRVDKGQALTEPGPQNGLPVHAPTSGRVIATSSHPGNHPSGLPVPTLTLEPDGLEHWGERPAWPAWRDAGRAELTRFLQAMGIAGLGGAGFPTDRKVAASSGLETLIINGAECEPYIVSDDRLMREQAAEIMAGTEILQHLTQARQVIIAIEDNKPEAIAAMQEALPVESSFTLQVIPTRYPSGGEKQLIQILTGQEVPSDGLPADLGILMQNTGTAYAISRAVYHGEPLLERVVTLTGEALQRPGTVWALLGTPVDFLLDQAGLRAEKNQRVIMGGPMMGFALPDLTAPVTKMTNCILAPTRRELPPTGPEMACIRCGQCEDVCPASLLPQQLHWLAQARDYGGLKTHHLADCIECGACAYVCPSEIPLVHYYRQAKAEIRERAIEQQKAEIARQRFEARQARLEREKAERLERHRKAAEARKKAQANRQQSADDPVQAAVARAKAKKAEQATADQQAPSAEGQDSKQAAVQAAIARAKARKAQQQQDPTDSGADGQASASPAEPSQQAQPGNQAATGSQTEQPAAEDPAARKKAAVQAAVARAKARKAQKDS